MIHTLVRARTHTQSIYQRQMSMTFQNRCWHFAYVNAALKASDIYLYRRKFTTLQYTHISLSVYIELLGLNIQQTEAASFFPFAIKHFNFIVSNFHK